MAMLLRAWFLTIVALLPLAGLAATAQDAIVGIWLTDDGGSKVEVASAKPLHNANNSDAALRDRPILGLQIVSGFKPAAAGGWYGGTVYSPRSGRSFPAEMSLTADGRLQIKVKAGIVSRTVYWTR